MSACGRLEAPGAAEREEWFGHLGDAGYHRALVSRLVCLHDVEGRPAPAPVELSGWVRVAAWNMQRGLAPVGVSAGLLGSCGADIWLLSELDSGMARTRNRDVAGELAAATGSGYAFGVEFVELGLGDAAERRLFEGATNLRALHGNAVMTTAALEAPAVVRLDTDGLWFGREREEPRVGGRLAVVGTVAIDGRPVQVASVHLESASDAEHRASQLASVLDAVEEREPGGPAVIGGDFNTFGATLGEIADHEEVRKLRAREPARFSWPVAHEPLFALAAGRGFGWVEANLAAPTTRHSARGLPDHVPLHLDWLLVRGLEARRPVVVPALGPDGSPLSDHDVVGASIRLAPQGRAAC